LIQKIVKSRQIARIVTRYYCHMGTK